MSHQVVFELNFKTPSQGAKTSAAFVLLAILCGCSGPSTFNSSAHPPTAVARAIGLQPTSSAGVDPLTVTTRARSQVTLTGNASDGGAAAIGNFSWTQTDGAGTPTPVLLYLDSDTITFTAPAVAQDTTLHFTLTVTTAGNASATAHVAVLVKPINDINAFLAPPDTPKVPNASQHHFSVAIGTLEGLGKLASPQEPALVSDAPVCVTLNPTINYVGRDGNPHTLNLPASQKQGNWSAEVGSAPPSSTPHDFNSYQNPRVSFDIPALNQDDLFVLFNNPVAGNDAATISAHLNQQLVPADIDKAFLSVTASVAAGSCDGTVSAAELTGKTLEILVIDESGNPVSTAASTATFKPDDLVSQQTNAPYETAQTTAAYYDAIDPLRAKTTLSSWLDANCFSSTAPNFGVTPQSSSSAHATYTNNYDLGFGRDMYFVTCTATSPAVVNGLAKVGDMASVVINYASLEGAASKLNPIIAVAMEYSAATDAATTGAARSQRRFPKFYAFAPDDRDGSFKRVMTVNFDHRGEKYVPGTCTVCHGGTIPTPGVANFIHSSPTDYPTVPDPQVGAAAGVKLGLGDTDSTFMPWDLDSLLYASAPQAANTDASFVGLSVNPANYSRSAMEPSLKILNQLAYCTWQPEIETGTTGTTSTADRFALVRALVSRWYGGTAAADGSYAADAACSQGSAPTASILPNSTYNDAGSVPSNWASQAPAGPADSSDLLYHQVFARNCRACHILSASLVDQFDGYAAFVSNFQTAANTATSTNGIQLTYSQGVMPLARLTMDRFWVDFSGDASAASILATNLQQAFPSDPGIAALTTGTPPTVVAPGTPNIVVSAASANITGNLDTSTTYAIPRFKGIIVDASKSSFVASYTWCLQVPGSSTCSAQPTGALTPTPSFDSSIPGAYVLQLSADNGLGVVITAAYHFAVPDLVPTYVGAPPLTTPPTSPCPAGLATSYDSTHTAPPYSIDVSSCFNPLGDETTQPFTLTITDAPSNQWTATVVPTVVAGAVPKINFVFTASAVGDAVVHYQLCDFDGQCATGQTRVSLVAKLQANTVSFRTYLQPSLALSALPPGFTATESSLPLSLTGLLQQDVIAPPGIVVTLTATTPTTTVGPSAAGTLSSNVVVSDPANGQTLPGFVYTPRAFSTPLVSYVTCDINGNSIVTFGAACNPVTFTQTLTASGATASAAPVNIEVRALTSFWQSGGNTPIFNYLGVTGSCVSCHTTGTAASKWLFTSVDSNATWLSLRQWAAKDSFNAAITDPTKAAVYTNPCLGTSGDGLNDHPTIDTTSAQCPTILQWVREGGNYN
jgi:mono/diheme cytochrome c family protein